MELKRFFALGAVSAVILSLTACGGKKESPKPADSQPPAASASAPAADGPKQVSDDVKKIVANEYKDFDEANQCWVVKSGADKYCLAPNGSKRTLFKDGNKTKLDFVVLASKGKLVGSELVGKSDGGISVVAVDKDNQVVAKLPFTKVWRNPQNDHDSHMVMVLSLGEAQGIAVNETVTVEWPVEKPGEHHNDLRRAAYDVTKVFLFDGSSIKPAMTLRTRFTDSQIPYHISAPLMTNGPVDEATGIKGFTFKANAGHKAQEYNGRTYEAKYNAAKKQFDVPAELRKAMKE